MYQSYGLLLLLCFSSFVQHQAFSIYVDATKTAEVGLCYVITNKVIYMFKDSCLCSATMDACSRDGLRDDGGNLMCFTHRAMLHHEAFSAYVGGSPLRVPSGDRQKVSSRRDTKQEPFRRTMMPSYNCASALATVDSASERDDSIRCYSGQRQHISHAYI